MRKHLLLLTPLLFLGCATINSQNLIIGTWKHDGSGGYVVFHLSGELELFDHEKNKQELFPGPGGSSRWEVLNDVESKQLFYAFTFNGLSDRQYIGIYEIKNGKLIVKDGPESRYAELYTKSNL